MASKIDTVSARDKLRLRRGPDWHRVSKGSYLGFRRMTREGNGRWLARWLDESSGKQIYKTLGELPELQPHLRFDAAQREALAWFDHLGRGGAVGKPTVRDACARYLQHVQTNRTACAANGIRARHDNDVLNDAKLAGMELAKLTLAHLDLWRKALREMPTRSGGCSRNMRRSIWRRSFMDCLCGHCALVPWPRCAQLTLMRVWKCSKSKRTNPAATGGSNYRRRLRQSRQLATHDHGLLTAAQRHQRSRSRRARSADRGPDFWHQRRHDRAPLRTPSRRSCRYGARPSRPLSHRNSVR